MSTIVKIFRIKSFFRKLNCVFGGMEVKGSTLAFLNSSSVDSTNNCDWYIVNSEPA
jgi:hypothetical protein